MSYLHGKGHCNTIKLVNLASFYNWNGPQYATALVRKGFSYTGRDAVVKCDVCKATANMNETDVVSLSNEHDRSCQNRENLGLVTTNPDRIRISSSIGYMPPCIQSNGWKKDLDIYTSFVSIMAAPSTCLCQCCKNNTCSIPMATESTDVHREKRLTRDMLVLTLKERLERNGNMPMHPEYVSVDKRRNSFKIPDVRDGNINAQAEAGFFIAENGRRECFFCDMALSKELLNYDPWKEHARWFPVCPHVVQQKGYDFIHDVLRDTDLIKNYYKGLKRPSQMQMDIILDAMKTYPRVIITETVEAFFIEYGSFPNRDELFYILESRRLWKTSNTYDYCH